MKKHNLRQTLTNQLVLIHHLFDIYQSIKPLFYRFLSSFIWFFFSVCLYVYVFLFVCYAFFSDLKGGKGFGKIFSVNRELKQYTNQDNKDEEPCPRGPPTNKTFTDGIVTYVCPCVKVLGFQVILDPESPRHVFETLYARLPEGISLSLFFQFSFVFYLCINLCQLINLHPPTQNIHTLTRQNSPYIYPPDTRLNTKIHTNTIMDTIINTYMCMMVYIRVHMVYIRVHMCIMVSICVYTCLCMYYDVSRCIVVYMCVYMCIHVYHGVYKCIVVYMCVYMCMMVYICLFVCMMVYVCVHMCIYVYYGVYICM